MITSVTIRAFRGIPDERNFTLKTITLLSGRNGLGKTTFFDAVDWCLFGRSSRFADDALLIENLYSPHDRPSVQIELSLRGESTVIRRTHDQILLDGHPADDRDILELLIADRFVFPPHSQTAEARVRDILYLEQARIRALVSTTDEDSRAALFQALLGIPHAATVRASIRKIKDTIDSRLRQLTASLTALDDEIRSPQFTEAADTLHEINRLRSEIRARAHQVLGLSPTVEKSASELQNLCANTERLLGENRRALEQALHSVERLDEELRQLTDELHARQLELRNLESLAAQAKAAAEAARAGSTRASQALLAARAQRDGTTHILESARRAAAQRSTLVQSESRRDEQRTLLESATRQHVSAADRLRAARAIANERSATVTALRARLASSAEDEKRTSQLSALQSQRDRLRDQLRQDSAAIATHNQLLDQLRPQLHTARAAESTSHANYESLLSHTKRQERATALALELRSLIVESETKQCPLCGFEYPSTTTLLAHVDQLQSRPTDQLRMVDHARGRADEARRATQVLEARIRDAESRVSPLQSSIETVSDRLSEVEVAISRLSVPLAVSQPAVPSSQLQQELAKAQAEASAATTTAQGLEAEFVRAEQEAGTASSLVSTLEREVAALQAALPDDTTSTPDLTLLDNALRTQEQEVATLGRKLEEAELLARQADESLQDCSRRVEAARSAVRRAAGRVEMTSSERLEAPGSVLEPGADREGIARSLNAVMERASQLAALSASITALAHADARNQALQQLQVLQRTRDNSAQDVVRVRRAEHRFSVIGEGLLRRAASEEREALTQQHSAIQDCYRALLPHKHLDEVDVDPTTGAIMVTDYLLQQDHRQVKAQHYLSTGQANALALSIFVGIALRQRVTPLECVLMDEPVQNLDDMHFLAFMALIKRVALDKQVIFSTADSNITEIFRRQIKSSWHRLPDDFVEYEWQDFSPLEGPTILEHP